MSFVSKIVKSRGNNLCLIIAPTLGGKKAWYFIRAVPFKLKKFKETVVKESVDFTDYGQVIRRGYGDYPPQSIINEMVELEGFDSET